MVVAGMAAYTDISKAHEIANEVRRVNKQLKEAQGLASTYNNRERLFGMPVTNVSISPRRLWSPRARLMRCQVLFFRIRRPFPAEISDSFPRVSGFISCYGRCGNEWLYLVLAPYCLQFHYKAFIEVLII